MITLSPDALAALCPMHAVLSPEGEITQAGPTLVKLCDRPLTGRSVFDVFEFQGPRVAGTMPGLLALSGRKLHMHLRGRPPLPLKGQILTGVHGGALLSLLFVILTQVALANQVASGLALTLFGLGLSSKVAFGVMHGLIPILLFTMNAIRQMRPVYLRTAGTLRLTPIQSLVHVLLPAILPEVVAGVRLGFALTLLGVLIGEMFASQRGLGYMAVNAMGLGDIPTIMAVALLITIIAVTCNSLMLMLDKKLQHR